jgi:predicted phosphoadenosine phosphosulfate sulfurtransferase
MKHYLHINVLEAFNNRLEIIFNEFDNVYFSVSGGKDSSVMVQLANLKAKEMGKKFDVLYIDLEAQYKLTIDHMNELRELSQIRDFYWISLPLQLRNAVSQLQPKWICWSPTQKDLWVRDLPKHSINIDNHEFDFYQLGMEFEDFITGFAEWYKNKKGGIVGAGIGIRSDESLNRWRTIHSQSKTTYKDYQWTTLLKPLNDVYNFYPMYDWKTQDIWVAVSKFDLKNNQIYELMYKNGLSIHEQRLCQPYGDDQKNGLDQFKAIEYETWEKVLNRVNGVNFGNIYARTSALGNLQSCKPEHLSWQQYSIFLLESLGIYNKDLMLHYIKKIKKFIKWWEKEHGCTMDQIPDEADNKLEAMHKVPSWRRIARAIERNDFYMKRLGFSQNQYDETLLKTMIEKYDNLFDVNNTTDTHLKRFYERELIENETY